MVSLGQRFLGVVLRLAVDFRERLAGFYGRLAVLALLLLLASVSVSTAQYVAVGDVTERAFRDAQLLGEVSLNNSWMVRPITPGTAKYSYVLRSMDAKGSKGLYARLMGVNSTILHNTKIGYGRNLGAMFPSNGMTNHFSVDAFARWGPVKLQLSPEFIYSQNLDFQQTPSSYPDWHWRIFYREHLNRIDLPERYREAAFLQVLPGNSSLMAEVGTVELGVSTRSLWWGPAKRNSLLMSNNAPGFFHVSVNSRRPLEGPFGRVEFQGIWGRLESSGREPLPLRRYDNFQVMPYREKPDDWRFITGLVFAWQPKWTPGLWVGMGRTLMAYSKDMNRVDRYFSFFRTPFESLPPREEWLLPDTRDVFDDKFAAYIRYVAPVEHLEFYAEWGRNMRPGSFFEFLDKPEHTMAYTLGMNKLYALSGNNQFFGIEAEITQTEKNNTWRTRDYPTWYVSENIPHGYTHKGQVLGAAIGPGSNSQYLGINYLWGQNRVGIFGERVIYNNDLYYKLFTTSIFRHWADLNLGITGEYSWNQLDFKYMLMASNVMNYKYIELTTRPGFQYIGKDLLNYHTVLTVSYRF